MTPTPECPRCASAETRFNLMLQEREFFAKQIRDIREEVFARDLIQTADHAMNRIADILARPNPVP